MTQTTIEWLENLMARLKYIAVHGGGLTFEQFKAYELAEQTRNDINAEEVQS